MSTCAAFRQFVTAYVDGELVGEEAAGFERHLAQCSACRRLLEEEKAIAALLHRARPQEAAPEALREHVTALAASRSHARSASRTWLAATAALVVAVAAAMGWQQRTSTDTGPASAFAALAVDSHLRYGRGQLPLEVTSAEPERVSSWFSGRVPFHLTLPDYQTAPGEQKFYRLEGGRLVSFRGDYAAYVAYRMDEQPVSLLVTTTAKVTPEGGDIVTSGTLRFHIEQVAGLQVITWMDKGLTYALASDVAVGGSRSCMVCHGSPEERRRVQEFPNRPGI